jgi:hypothetical protein
MTRPFIQLLWATRARSRQDGEPCGRSPHSRPQLSESGGSHHRHPRQAFSSHKWELETLAQRGLGERPMRSQAKRYGLVRSLNTRNSRDKCPETNVLRKLRNREDAHPPKRPVHPPRNGPPRQPASSTGHRRLFQYSRNSTATPSSMDKALASDYFQDPARAITVNQIHTGWLLPLPAAHTNIPRS